VRSEYVSVLGKIYASHFRSYLSSMERMQQAVASQTDVIGLADAPTGVNNVLSLFGKTQVRAADMLVWPLWSAPLQALWADALTGLHRVTADRLQAEAAASLAPGMW
jgi:hypothetical protein